MNYFLGSLTLAIVFLGAACTSTTPTVTCDWVVSCGCGDGTVQTATCAGPTTTCAEACTGHDGDAGAPADDAGDAGDMGGCLILENCTCDDGTMQHAGCPGTGFATSCTGACVGHGGYGDAGDGGNADAGADGG